MLNRTNRRLRDTYDCTDPDPAREAPQRVERDGGDPQARPESEIVYLGTLHSATDSIYFALHRDFNYDMRMWPSRVPTDLTPYKGCLAPLIEKRMGATLAGRLTPASAKTSCFSASCR